MIPLAHLVAIIALIAFTLFDVYVTLRIIQALLSPQPPSPQPRSFQAPSMDFEPSMEEKLQTTREHTASVLKEMKDSTRRTERTRPPSGNFFYEMHRTPGPRWTKRKDNELLLAIATQPRDTPDFSEIADKLGKKYTPDEVESRYYFLASTLTSDLYPLKKKWLKEPVAVEQPEKSEKSEK